MSREIKFRAWDKKRGEWYGAEQQFYGFHLWGECTLLDTPRIEDLQHLVVDQFTGLQDANGVDIYEGDLVDIVETGYRITGYISRNDGCFGHFEPHSKYYTPLFRLVRAESIIEVIGNIHQNPELLEATND